MATHTIYTSTIRVPIYASWKCPNCGEINFSWGNIFCERQAVSSSGRRSELEEAKNTASSLVQNEWKQNALNIIFSPQENPQNVRRDLFFQNTNCTKCGKKPKWDKDMKYISIMSLSLIPAIISGIVAINMKTSWVAWLIFAVALGVFVYCIVSEKTYIKTLREMSAEYLPVIGSLNDELIAAAKHQGKKLPSPDETIQLIRDTKTVSKTKASVDSLETKGQGKVDETTSACKEKEHACYCRKCGSKFQKGSAFCNKCGTAIIQ